MNPTKKLILFDIDGTLLDSGGCCRRAARKAMLELFGTSGLMDDLPFAGKTDWQILNESLEPAGLTRAALEARLMDFNDAVSRHLEGLIDECPVQPCAGAREVVTTLQTRDDVLIGIVTGNMAGLVPIKLRAAGYDPAVFVIGAYGSEGWERAMLPPLALQRAVHYAGHDFAPEQVVIVGDTPGDIECARSIQARTVAVATGPFSVEELRAHGPTHVFESMADRDAFLNALLVDGACAR